MEWSIFVSSFLLAIAINMILSHKWKINYRIGLICGLCIGMLTGLFINGINILFNNMAFITIGLMEFLCILLVTVLAICFRFFRDPERVPPEKDNVILSPADGTIRYVQRLKDGEIPFSEKKNRVFPLIEMTKTDILSEGAYLIGIEMSVLDVHVNRAPIEGKIIYQKLSGGPFLSLRRVEALLCNERVTTIIDNGSFRIGMIQIASRLVRRIVSYLSEGMQVQLGQRIGMIKFGSQVDLVIPKLEKINIRINPGDKVKAGYTIICSHDSV